MGIELYMKAIGYGPQLILKAGEAELGRCGCWECSPGTCEEIRDITQGCVDIVHLKENK